MRPVALLPVVAAAGDAVGAAPRPGHGHARGRAVGEGGGGAGSAAVGRAGGARGRTGRTRVSMPGESGRP